MFWQMLIIGISVGGMYALLATGFSLIQSLLGFSNWAHGEVAMIGAYIAFFSIASANLPFPVAAVLGLLAAGLVSVLSERLLYRRIRENKSPLMFSMIAAMGFSVVLQNGSMLMFGTQFRMFPMLFTGAVQFAGIRVRVLDLFVLGISAVVLIGLELLVSKTKFGLGVRSIASNSYTASLLGINVDRIYVLVFFLSGFLAAVAGILYGLQFMIYPMMGSMALKAFIACILGGLGSIRGAILGAMLIGIAETMVAGYVSSGLRDIIVFTMLIVILLVRPSGLLGVEIKEKA